MMIFCQLQAMIRMHQLIKTNLLVKTSQPIKTSLQIKIYQLAKNLLQIKTCLLIKNHQPTKIYLLVKNNHLITIYRLTRHHQQALTIPISKVTKENYQPHNPSQIMKLQQHHKLIQIKSSQHKSHPLMVTMLNQLHRSQLMILSHQVLTQI